MSERLIVIGGGGAGTAAATIAKRLRPSMQVSVFTEFEDIAYSPCGIPFVHGREIPRFEDLFLSTVDRYVADGLDMRMETVVTELDLDRRIVTARNQHEGFDQLIVCTGFIEAAAIDPIPDADEVRTLERGSPRTLAADARPFGSELAVFQERVCLGASDDLGIHSEPSNAPHDQARPCRILVDSFCGADLPPVCRKFIVLTVLHVCPAEIAPHTNVRAGSLTIRPNATTSCYMENLDSRGVRLIASLVVLLAVAACGGGGGESATAPDTPTPPAPGMAAVSGLEFPSNDQVPDGETVRFKFANPHMSGLPIYGPGGNGVTYILRVMPKPQAGYYTTFFWGNDDGQGNLDTYFWKNGLTEADTYYGAHPYPDLPPDGTMHSWEIAVETADFLNGAVIYDRWYTQAVRVWADVSGKHHEFYWDLPNTDAGHMVSHTAPTTYGVSNPPQPALTFGDAPWSPGRELCSCVLRGIQIYSSLLSLADIQSEIASPLSTGAGSAAIWYLNLNPTPTDISDKSGQGHHPDWVGNNRPSLWSQ